MGTLPHVFLSRMLFLGHWAWQRAAWRPSTSQKGPVVPEGPGWRRSHRAAVRSLLPGPRALETFRAGRLGAKAGFSGTGGAVASRIGLKAGVRQVQGRGFQQGTDL